MTRSYSWLRQSYRLVTMLSGFVLLHTMVIAAASCPLWFRFGAHCEAGSNGLAFRVCCASVGPVSGGWSVLGSAFRLESNADRFFLQVPVWGVFCGLLVIAGILWTCEWIRRRKIVCCE